MDSSPEYVDALRAYGTAHLLLTAAVAIALVLIAGWFRRALARWTAAGTAGDEPAQQGKLARRFVTVLISGAMLLTLFGFLIVRLTDTMAWLCAVNPQAWLHASAFISGAPLHAR